MARIQSPNAHRLFPPALRSQRDGYKIPIHFNELDRIALRPCFAGSGLSQSRQRRDTGGVVAGMSEEFCAKSLMTNSTFAP